MIKELINRIINVSRQPLARYSFQRRRKLIEVQHEGIPASMQTRRFIHILLLFSTLLLSLLYVTISAELSSVCRRISPKKYSEFSGRIWFMALCFCVDFQQRLKFGQIFFFLLNQDVSMSWGMMGMFLVPGKHLHTNREHSRTLLKQQC